MTQPLPKTLRAHQKDFFKSNTNGNEIWQYGIKFHQRVYTKSSECSEVTNTEINTKVKKYTKNEKKENIHNHFLLPLTRKYTILGQQYTEESYTNKNIQILFK